jgi:hypothetical protein
VPQGLQGGPEPLVLPFPLPVHLYPGYLFYLINSNCLLSAMDH